MLTPKPEILTYQGKYVSWLMKLAVGKPKAGHSSKPQNEVEIIPLRQYRTSSLLVYSFSRFPNHTFPRISIEKVTTKFTSSRPCLVLK